METIIHSLSKKCFKCGQVHPLTNFYKHAQMADGHLNKCKDCNKKDVIENYQKNAQEPAYMSKERARGRKKYHKYKYKSKSNKKQTMDKYFSKYPEKEEAAKNSSHIKVPEGYQKHHWSYNEDHYKDVIVLTEADHYKIHRYINYDSTAKMYRSLDGTLLESKEMHQKYIDVIRLIPY